MSTQMIQTEHRLWTEVCRRASKGDEYAQALLRVVLDNDDPELVEARRRFARSSMDASQDPEFLARYGVQ